MVSNLNTLYSHITSMNRIVAWIENIDCTENILLLEDIENLLNDIWRWEESLYAIYRSQ
jgi:hypothetical protein